MGSGADESTPDKGEVGTYLRLLLMEVGKVPGERLVDGACIDSDLKVESVAFVEIQVALEERFNIEIDPIELLELNELSAIVDYLYERVQRRMGGSPLPE